MEALKCVLTSLVVLTLLALYMLTVSPPSAFVAHPKPAAAHQMSEFQEIVVSDGVEDSSEDSSEWLADMEAKYRRINSRIERVCRKNKNRFHGKVYGKTLERSILSTYTKSMLDRQHGLTYCRQAKVGTSTWLKHFLSMSPYAKLGIEGPEKLHKVVPPLFEFPERDLRELGDLVEQSDAPSAIQSFASKRNLLSFSFVRHPFDRLVSAYTDKVLDAAKGYAIPGLRGKTFPEFVDYVLENFEVKRCDLNPFCAIDVHWRPQYMRCLYCDIPYDVVGKVETFTEDVRFIVAVKNLTHLIPDSVASLKSHASSKDSKSVKFFSQLSSDQIQKLYRMYEPDFLLFDYDPNEYMSE